MTLVILDTNAYLLAGDFSIPLWHSYELLAKRLTAKMVTADQIRGIVQALEDNGDMTATWVAAKHTTFAKIFGKNPNG